MDASTSSDWPTLLALAFVLGLKHGLDADHLATIDGLTRHNSRLQHRLAAFCGSFFSLGHGAVVMATALGLSVLAGHGQVPEWLDALGAWVSIGFLLLLGGLNLWALWRTAPDQMVRPLGLKAWGLRGLQQVSHPVMVALVGALFALSFDTLSQAAFFALAGGRLGGAWPAASLALAFLLGMLVTDGLNGLWMARLMARADQVARRASRVMGLTIVALSWGVAGLGLAKLYSPTVDAWAEGKELLLGLAVLASLMLAFGLVLRGARRRWA
jgi:high-affinity nickel-transport protein